MRGTRMLGLAAASLVALAAGCGGAEMTAPVQTVDMSGLIEVDEWNEKLPVDKEEFEAAVAETLQERAPAGVRVVYTPGTVGPIAQQLRETGGRGGGGKRAPLKPNDPSKPPPGVPPLEDDGGPGGPPAGGPAPPPGAPAKPRPGEAAPSPAVCGFDPSKPGCETFCAQNPEFATCKKPGEGTPPPPGGGTPLPPIDEGGGPVVPVPPQDVVNCRVDDPRPVCAPETPGPLPDLCEILPFACGDGPDFDFPFFLTGVIDDSFEKVGVEFEPGSAAGAVPLAKVSIAGVKTDVQASETGEIVTEVEEVTGATSVSQEPETGEAGEPSEREAGTEEPADPSAPADPELAPDGTELPAAPEGEAPAAPPDGAPAPEPVPAEPAPQPAPEPAPSQ